MADGPYTSSDMSAGLDIHNYHRKPKIPRWVSDKRVMERIQLVYQDYTRRLTLRELTAKYGISISQVYKDINRARELMAMMYAGTMLDTLEEQIEVRRGHIRQLQEQLSLIEESQRAEEEKYQSVGALAVIAKLHDSLSKHESAIEQLLGLKARMSGEDKSAVAATATATAGVTAVFDMREGKTSTAPVIKAEAHASTSSRSRLMSLDHRSLVELAEDMEDFDRSAIVSKDQLVEYLLEEHPSFAS